jgi:putative selenium metabolism protein SsnA
MIILNAKIVTWEKPNRILNGTGLRIQNGLIADMAVDHLLKEKYPEDEVLDAGGQYVFPGNICAHTHFYGAYSRGMGIPGAAPDAFPAILDKLWWPLDKSLTLEDVKNSTLVCLAESIRHGTTTLVDHHASPNAIEGSLDEIEAAVDQAGLRAVLCYEVTDRDGKEKALAGIRENVRMIRKCKQYDPSSARVASMFGMHASLTLSDETLELCMKEAPEGCGFHIHVAEHEVDEYDCITRSGTRIVDRLRRFGILGPRSLVGHAVHIDAKEIGILAETHTWVSHQPRSNMNNGVGLGNVEAMMRAGVKVGLGNDGFSNAMWEEWKAAYLGHKLYNRDPRRMNGMDVVQMAVYNNAELAEMFFPGAPIGTIQPGARADLMLVDYHPYTELTAGNLPWHILFGFNESMITTTLAAGKILMKDRQLLTLDEEEISAKGRELSAQVWKRYQARF